jgi:hypothetical protein
MIIDGFSDNRRIDIISTIQDRRFILARRWNLLSIPAFCYPIFRGLPGISVRAEAAMVFMSVAPSAGALAWNCFAATSILLRQWGCE